MNNPVKFLRYRFYRHRGYSYYHARIAADFWWTAAKIMHLKREELKYYMQDISFRDQNSPIKIAVLGCADKRYIKRYKKLFLAVLQQPVSIVIYDIETKHLLPAASVHQYDSTQTLPEKFDLIYSHILLNFLTPAKQQKLIHNNPESLNKSGQAVHIYAKKISPESEHVANSKCYRVKNTTSVPRVAVYPSLFW